MAAYFIFLNQLHGDVIGLKKLYVLNVFKFDQFEHTHAPVRAPPHCRRNLTTPEGSPGPSGFCSCDKNTQHGIDPLRLNCVVQDCTAGLQNLPRLLYSVGCLLHPTTAYLVV